MDKLLKGVRSVLYGFSVVAMSVMLVIIFAQVVTRYLFNYTPEWSEELARFLFVWVVFLGSALIITWPCRPTSSSTATCRRGHVPSAPMTSHSLQGRTVFGTVLDVALIHTSAATSSSACC
jgi:hypothetical protein